MKPEQIEFLKSLDVNGEYGTLQSVLMQDNLNQVAFDNACKYLLKMMMSERQMFLKENIKYARVLKENGLYTSELILGE